MCYCLYVRVNIISFSAALIWQEWVVVGTWLALGVFFYFYSKRKYGAEFGRDIFIITDESKTEEVNPKIVAINKKYEGKHFVVTVGCEYGSGGPEIAKMVADYFGIEYYNRDLVDKVVEQIGVDKGLVEKAQHARHEYITGKKRGDRHTRDILLNSSLLGWRQTADFIIDLVERKYAINDEEVRKEA